MSDDGDEWAGRGWEPLSAFVAGLAGESCLQVEDIRLGDGSDPVLHLEYRDTRDTDDEIDRASIEKIAGTYAALVRVGIDAPRAVKGIVPVSDGDGAFTYRIPRDLAEDMAAGDATAPEEIWPRIEGLDVTLVEAESEGEG